MTPNEVRFYGALTSLIYARLSKYHIIWFDLRFSNYQGFNLIDLSWDIIARRYSYRQALTSLEVLQLMSGSLKWQTLAKEIADRIEKRIKYSITVAEEENCELLPTNKSN